MPISADTSSMASPLRIIKEMTAPDDFVALKLDIDKPSIEIPIARDILSDPIIAGLVDEFFFELHFQCDLIAGCWNQKPDEMMGLKLDRYSVLLFFKSFREAGIRSHFWP
jgi:hypothetical protein